MGIETERKFLLKNQDWRKENTAPPLHLVQGYFERSPGGPAVRVRIAGAKGFLTVKGRPGGPEGISRSEYEYAIPPADAEKMLSEFCGSRVVEKLRYTFPAQEGLVWEIDEYLGRNEGLFTAEIELPDPRTPFKAPEWLGREISDEARYTNGALSVAPFSTWKDTP